MSQLADLEEVVTMTPMSPDDQAKLFFEILSALEWEVTGVNTWEDAKVYLFETRHN